MPDFLGSFLGFPDSLVERLVYLAVLVLISVKLFFAPKTYRRYLGIGLGDFPVVFSYLFCLS